MTTMLAHQGGWDEVVLVVLPIVILALLLRTARKRAERETTEEDEGPLSTGPEATDDDR